MRTEQPVLLRHGPVTGSGATGLLLHGMANSAAVWRRLVEHPVPGIDWTAAELPWRGDGVADWGQHTDPAHWIGEAIERCTAERGTPEVLVAHSYAATMLLDLLTREPDAIGRYGVRAVAFLAPFYRPSPADFDWDTMAGLVDKFLLTMREGIRVIGGGRGNPELHDAMARRVCEQVGPYGWTRFFSQYLSTPWARPERIDVPAVVVSGTADPIAPPAESVALAARLPFGRFVPIEGCGHFPMVERPGPLAQALAELIGTTQLEPLESAR